MTEVTRAGWRQLLHVSFLGFLFMRNTCSDSELWTHGVTRGLDVGKWDWPGKSNRTLPGLVLELLMVRNSPDGGQSLCWELDQVPRQWVLPVGLSLALLLEVGIAKCIEEGERLLGRMREQQYALCAQLSLAPPEAHPRHGSTPLQVLESWSNEREHLYPFMHCLWTPSRPHCQLKSVSAQRQVPRTYHTLGEVILYNFRFIEGS